MTDDAQAVALAAEIAAVEEDWSTLEDAAHKLLGISRREQGKPGGDTDGERAEAGD